MATPIPRSETKRYILIKEETTAGSDAVPTSTNGVYLESLTVKPLNVKDIERNPIRPFAGSGSRVVASYDATIEMEVALAPGGNAAGVPVAGTVPQWDELLRGCGVAKIVSASQISGTAQGGTVNSIVLAAGASETDDAYFGLSIAATISSGAAQAPSSAAKNSFKLAASDKQHGGTLQTGSTTTALKFAASASEDDGDYVGMTVAVAGESAVISDYVGSTKTATLATPLTTAPGAIAYVVQRVSDYYAGMLATVEHFSGTLRDSAQYPSTTAYVHINPANVGGANILGLLVRVTTGANLPETVRISSYNTTSGRAGLASKLAVEPTSSSTFKILEALDIISSDGATQEVTLAASLRFVTTAGTAYEISEYRLITNYNGTTKRATVSHAFLRNPGAGTSYLIGAYVKYYPISSGHISNTIYYYDDGALHTFTFAKGTATLAFDNGELPKMKFNYLGLAQRYEDAPLPVYDKSGWVEPLPVNYENTKGVIVANYAGAVMDKLSVDLGVDVVHVNAPGADITHIKGHKSKGAMTIWKPLPSEFDVYAEVKEGRLSTLAFTHGPIGNQIAFASKDVQIGNPSETTKEGISMVGVDLTFAPTSEGSDWALILQ